jgi:hypothetical protein
MAIDDPASLVSQGPVDDHGQPLPPAVAGVVARTPAHTTDELQVTIGAFDDGARSWSFSCPWQPRFTAGGTYVPPTGGDRCLVLFDDEQAPWVPIYWPS